MPELGTSLGRWETNGTSDLLGPLCLIVSLKDFLLYEGENGTLILEDDIDLSRGSSIIGTTAEEETQPSKQINATICWMQNQPLNTQSKYFLQQGTQQLQTKVTTIEGSPSSFKLNDIGNISLRLSEPILSTPFRENKNIGRFILIDPQTNNTAAVGFIR